MLCGRCYIFSSDEDSEMTTSESSYLKSSRLDSQSSETDLEGVQGEPKKKRNRQHKKKQWASILKDLDLRVMSKLVFIHVLSFSCQFSLFHCVI